MLFPPKNFDVVLKEMKAFAEYTMPFTHPKQKHDDEINDLKAREEKIDGYNVIVFYSKSDHGNYYSEIVQIMGRYTPFLPFSLVCKIGKKFLGNKHLSFIDFIRDNRKVYCWTVKLDTKNNPIANYTENVLDCVYEGLEYIALNQSHVNFR